MESIAESHSRQAGALVAKELGLFSGTVCPKRVVQTHKPRSQAARMRASSPRALSTAFARQHPNSRALRSESSYSSPQTQRRLVGAWPADSGFIILKYDAMHPQHPLVVEDARAGAQLSASQDRYPRLDLWRVLPANWRVLPVSRGGLCFRSLEIEGQFKGAARCIERYVVIRSFSRRT
jgi:hypothetical protein